MSSRTCHDIAEYSKPQEIHFIGKKAKEIGCIAQDIPHSKMPKHWSKMVAKDSDDEYERLKLY